MKRIALTLAALSAVALVGVGGAAVATAAAAESEPARVVPVAAAAPAVTAEQAGVIARDRVGGGCVDEIEREGAGSLWKVEVDRDAVDHEVWVDATTGAVTRAEQRVDDDADTCDARPEIDDDRGGQDDD